MFSQTVEYALRAMVQLAAEAPEACTTHYIAESTRVPGAYLAKVLQSLRRGGLIHSRRGVGGGVKLARPPKKINLLEVINAVEPLQRSVDAPKGRTAGSSLASLNRRLDLLLDDVRKTCANVSLADVSTSRKPAGAARTAKAKPKAKRGRKPARG